MKNKDYGIGWKYCILCGFERELKNGYCKICQDINDTIREVRKTRKLIPRGMYCYKEIKKTKNGYKRIGICPYWFIKKDRPKQENGYCAYLKKGDWDLNKEKHKEGKWTDGKGNPIEPPKEVLPLSLLWDMVKECGINEEI